MMKCSVCGSENPEGASFCKTCGSPIDKSSKDAQCANYPASDVQSPGFEQSNDNEIAYPWGEYPAEYVDESKTDNAKNLSNYEQTKQDPTPPVPLRETSPKKSVPPPKKRHEEKSKNRTGLIVLLISLIVILVAAVCVVGYIIWNESESDDVQTIQTDTDGKGDKKPDSEKSD